jgi:hypothetical protein
MKTVGNKNKGKQCHNISLPAFGDDCFGNDDITNSMEKNRS